MYDKQELSERYELSDSQMQAINIHLLTRYDAATPGWGTVSRPSYAKPRKL
jgi:hypothetical protein